MIKRETGALKDRSSTRINASNDSLNRRSREPDKNSRYIPLKTKLYIPPLRSELVSRSRLFNRLNQGYRRKLTIISAPAGFGKTTLLADWVHQCKVPVAWFSVDTGDNDPVIFLNYVIAGLQTLETRVGNAALALLRSPQPPPIESILTNLINDVSDTHEDIVLVIDDYHVIESRRVHNLISFFIEHMPMHFHVIIATRSDPPISLSRWRSQNHLIELRTADLCFTADEATQFLNVCLKLKLSPDEIELLESRTEGWIAGLQLAAISIRSQKDPSRFISHFSGDNRYIMDYLVEEVIHQQSEHLRQFLLQTSILERMSASLCDAVTRSKNSHYMLEEMDKANLFIIPLDDQRCWYRYHHLFADLLKQRLASTQADLVTKLHSRASQWFANKGFNSEAIEHTLAAKDYEQTARLIEIVAESDWDRAQGSQVMRWCQRLPEELINTNPGLCIFYARELFKSGHLEKAEKKLQTAEQILLSTSTRNTSKENLQGRIAVIRAYMSSRTGDVSRIIHFSNQALKLLPQKELIWRSVAATTLGFAYGWAGAGDLVKAQRAFSEAMRISEEAGNIYYNIFAGSCLAGVMLMRGKLIEAKNISQQSLSLALKNGIVQTGIVGSLYGNLGMIRCEWADIDEGIDLIKKGIELSEQGRDPVILASCRISLLRALIYRKDIAGAFKVIEKFNESQRKFTLPPWITNTTSAFNVLFWLAKGDLNRALQWVKERELSIDDKLENLRGIEYLALTNILIAQKQLDDALRFSQRILEMAQSGDNAYLQIETRLLRVSIFTALKQKTAALYELKSAIKLGEPGGLIMIFVSKGKPVADLVEEILAKRKRDHDETTAGFSLSYVKKLLTVFKSIKPPKIEGLVDPMSDRELEVLYLIAAGLKNKEIADKLFISLNTVKTHTKHINSKLAVNSRTKAVVRAKKLGLI